MTKQEYQKLIKAIEEGPIYWDPRGDDEDYEYTEKSAAAWEKIQELLKQYVEPNLL